VQRKSIDVGEVIAEVADEPGAWFGLPVLCLAEVSRAVTDRDRLELLVNHPAATLFSPEPDSWQALAATYDTVGRLDAASAVLAAIDVGCDVLSPGCTAGSRAAARSLRSDRRLTLVADRGLVAPAA
jgi:hypothetical protein